MGKIYTQHSTGAKDGKAGFAEFFQDLFRRNPKCEIEIVRAFEDGPFVFLQAYQNLNDGAAQWVTADIFRADADGRIVEHWDVIEAYEAPRAGEPDQVKGSFAVDRSQSGDESKVLVRRFLVEAFQNKNAEAFDEFVAEDVIQHDAKIGQGRAAWRRHAGAHDVSCDFVFKVLGDGNWVAAYSKTDIDDAEFALFDIFCIEDGKIAEHWDVAELVPPRAELANSGKF
jgi:predicted SnoaL-like aldol condensation-catalyzing enzyme